MQENELSPFSRDEEMFGLMTDDRNDNNNN